MAELGCSQAPQMEYDCKFKLNLLNELNPQGQTGRLWRWFMLHPSLVPLLSLPIGFRKKAAQDSKLEKEFEAMIGPMVGNLCKRRSTCPSLPLGVLTSKPTSFMLLLDYEICNVVCTELTITLRMTALLFLQQPRCKKLQREMFSYLS